MARRKGPSLTQQQVVDAAVACVLADGPDGLGVSRVARELGIKPPSLYNHVGKGDALAKLVFVEGNRRLLAALKPAVREVPDARGQIVALAVTLRRWALENPGLYAFMARIEPDNDDPAFAEVMMDILDLFARPLGYLGVGSDETIHAVRGLRAAMHGFVLLESSAQFKLADKPEDSFVWLVEAILDGVTN